MFNTTKFDVMYAGQLRFVECTSNHTSMIRNASNVYAVLTDRLMDNYYNNANLGSSFSVTSNELTIEQAVEILKNNTGVSNIKFLPYSEFTNVIPIDTPAYFAFYHLLMILDNIQENDAVVLSTTDSIFWGDRNSLQRNCNRVNNFFNRRIPAACVQSSNDNGLLHNQLIILNRAAVKMLKENWRAAISNFFAGADSDNLRQEIIWYNIFNYCNIKLLKYTFIDSKRFRANMDFSKIEDFGYVKLKRKEWVIFKNNFKYDSK